MLTLKALPVIVVCFNSQYIQWTQLTLVNIAIALRALEKKAPITSSIPFQAKKVIRCILFAQTAIRTQPISLAFQHDQIEERAMQ